jgi:hypothetical protein
MKKALFSILSLLVPLLATASTTDAIQTALDAAEQHVLRQKAKAVLHSMAANGEQGQALSATALRFGLTLPPSPPVYRTGMQWDVLSYGTLTVTPAGAAGDGGKSALFHFEVKSADASEIRIRVTPKAGYGLMIVDPNVAYVDFVYTPGLKLKQKLYQLHGYRYTIPVSPDHMKVGVSPMEGFPLDLPELGDAEKDTTCDAKPDLPSSFKHYTDRAGFRGYPVVESCWTTYDLFGHQAQSVWPLGQPFPTYMKSAHHGISILVPQGGSQEAHS